MKWLWPRKELAALETTIAIRFGRLLHWSALGIVAVMWCGEFVGIVDGAEANAKLLEGRLEKQLNPEAAPEAARTGIMFRLGRGVKEITSPPSPKGDWTDHAFRLGRMFRRGFKR